MKRLLFGLFPFGLLFGIAGQAMAAIVVNGDFEAVQIGPPFVSSNPADVPGWTHSGSPGDGPLWHVGYSDPLGSITVAGRGNQFVTMGGGVDASGTAHWEQLLTGLTPSTTYALTFDMATEVDSSLISSQSITVDFPTGSSTPAMTFTAGPSSANYWRNWETKTMDFVAGNSSVDLRFSATTQYDVGLDDVRVSAVPEPSTLAAFGIGAFVVVCRTWRRRRRALI
jgi:hypothetical protein